MKITAHYHRIDGVYDQTGLWIWDASGDGDAAGREVFASARDEFGVTFRFEITEFDGEHPRIGIIPRIRKSWKYKDGGDRFWTPDCGGEIWLVQDEEAIHTSLPDVTPHVRSALCDGPDEILLSFSHPLPEPVLASLPAVVKTESGHQVFPREVMPFGDVEENGGRRFALARVNGVSRHLDADPVIAINGYGETPILPRRVSDRFEPGSGDRFGIRASAGAVRCALFSPWAGAVQLCLYRGIDDPEPAEVFSLVRADNGVWQGEFPGDWRGWHASYRRLSAGGRLLAEFADPHAPCSQGRTDRTLLLGGTPSELADIDVTRRERVLDPCESLIYEVHVRDFTIHATSGSSHGGLYAGLAEPGTRLPGGSALATGVDHLVELGVTHVQLLPVQDFDNDEQQPEYNWGYMTAFFNSPEGWYASTPAGDARIGELRSAIAALHRAGIGVVLDVVYNHTGVMNPLENSAPGYYHRRRDDGQFWNGSGTGNEFRTEAPFARRFLRDSLRYWVEEYGIDGFRFDLMGLMDADSLAAVRDDLRAIRPDILLYGEPWTAQECGLARITDGEVSASIDFAAFNDDFRDALKGDPNGATPGYVQAGWSRNAVKGGIAGSIDQWAGQPSRTINYADCHDNLTLWDKIAISCPNDEAGRAERHVLALAILAVSQGIPFIHGGTEFLRSKGGNRNSYDAGDGVNAIDWSLKEHWRNAWEFVRGMFALRAAHPVLRLGTAEEIRRRIHFHEEGRPATSSIQFTLDGADLPGESWVRVAVAINPTDGELAFPNLAGPGARLFARGMRAAAQGLGGVDGERVSVPARSLALAAVEKES